MCSRDHEGCQYKIWARSRIKQYSNASGPSQHAGESTLVFCDGKPVLGRSNDTVFDTVDHVGVNGVEQYRQRSVGYAFPASHEQYDWST